jgi:hypothetical protein
MKHSRSFKHDVKIGEHAEDWVNELFNGNSVKIEVKVDYMAHKTGNVFIEYSSRGKPSGIATTDAKYWMYRIEAIDCSLLLGVEHLKQKLRGYYMNNMYIQKGGDNNTSIGFLVPIAELFKR